MENQTPPTGKKNVIETRSTVKIRLFVFFILTFLFSIHSAFAQLTLSSRANANWNVISTWQTATLNNSAIATGVTVTFTSTTLGILPGDQIWNGTTAQVGTVLSVNPGVDVTLTVAATGNVALNAMRIRRVPTATDNVVVSVGNTVTVDVTTAVTDLTVTGTLTFGNFTLGVTGATTVGGTVNMNNGGAILNLQSLNFTGGTIKGSATGTINVGGNVTCSTGNGTIGRGNFNIAGTTTVSSGNTLTFSNTNGTKTFTGLVSNAGIWTHTANEDITFSGGLANTGTMTNTGTGTYTFSTNQTITGSSAITFGGVVAIGGNTVTNQNTGIVTMNSNLTGAGTWINDPNSYVSYLGTTAPAPTLTNNANSTWNYAAGANQPIKSATYYNLITSGGAFTKTLAGVITVNGNVDVTTGTLSDGGFAMTGSAGKTFTLAAGTFYTTSRNAAPWFPSNHSVSLNNTSTVTYTANGPYTLSTIPSGYGNLIFTGTNTKTLGTSTTVNSNLTISAGTLELATNDLTVNGTTILTGNLSDNSATGTNTFNILTFNGGTLQTSAVTSAFAISSLTMTGTGAIGQGNVTVSLTSDISNTLTFSSATGTKTFTGDVTVGGTWTNNTQNSPITFGGSLFVNSGGTFNAGSGVQTFSGTNKFIGGTLGTLAIPSATISGSYTNNCTTLTVATALTGAGSLVQANNSGLVLGGTMSLPAANCNFAVNSNTVTYNSTTAAQSVLNTTYHNLIINKATQNGSAAGNIIVNGTLTISSTTGTFIIGANTLTINNPIAGSSANLNAGATSSLVINGTVAGIVIPTSVTALDNLTLNNANGTSLQAPLALTTSLTLTNGRLTLGTNNLSLAAGTTISGAPFGNTKMIITNSTGVVSKVNPAAAFVFPIGDNTLKYAPVTITTGGTGTVTMQTFPVKDPNNLHTTIYLNRYWKVTSTIGAGNLVANYTYAAGEDVSGAGNLGASYYKAGWNTPTAAPLAASFPLSIANTTIGAAGLTVSGIDVSTPTVTSITPSVSIVNDGTTTFSLAILFSETMDVSLTPSAISFTPVNPLGAALISTGGSWSGSTYTATYNVIDNNTDYLNVRVTVGTAGVKDVVGNSMSAAFTTVAKVFDVKLTQATVTSVTSSVGVGGTITNSTASPFWIRVQYNQSMDVLNPPPTITFPGFGEDPSPTLTPAGGGGWSTTTFSNDTYTQNYTIGGNQTIASMVDVNIAGGRDAASGNINLQTPMPQNDLFYVDRLLPAVVSVTPSTSIINRSTATFSLDILYNKVMSPGGTNPAVTYTVGNPTTATPTITLSAPVYTWLADNKTCRVTYTLNNTSNMEIPSITVNVTGAQDPKGNVQTAFAGANNFIVDTKAPTGSGWMYNGVAAAYTIRDGNVTFTVTVDFIENMINNGTADPVITITGFNFGGTLGVPVGAWSGLTRYVATYVVSDMNQKVLNIPVSVSGARDAAGNAMTSTYNFPTNFNIDMQNPSVLSIVPATAPVSAPVVIKTNPPTTNFTLTITYDKAMNTGAGFYPTVSISGNPASVTQTAPVAGDWTGGGTIFTARYTINATSEYLSGLKATVINGQDPSGNVQNAYTENVNTFNIDMGKPVLSGIEAAALAYVEEMPATNITGTIVLTDVGNDLTGATVVISANYQAAQDVLAYIPVAGITGVCAGNTCTLSGNSTAANYQIALRSITYYNSSNTPNTTARTVTFTTTDAGYGASNSVTRNINITAFNDPPVFTSTPVSTGQPGLPYSYTVAATDPDGTAITYTVSGPGWLSFSPSPNLVGTIPITPTATTYNVTVTATDAGTPVPNKATTQTFTIFVNAGITVNAAGGANFTTIQAAINSTTVNGDQIFVANGTYNENLIFPTGRNIEVIGNSVTNVIVNGGANGSVVTFPAANTSKLSNVTLTNGSGTNASPGLNAYCNNGYYGGGIYMLNASPTIDNCIIQNNIAKKTSVLQVDFGGSGGGIYIGGGSPTIKNTIVTNNQAEIYRGAGICIDNATPVFDKVTVTGNSGCNYGAGFAIFNSTVNLSNVSSITGNSSSYVNGHAGIMLFKSTLNMSGTSVTGNTGTLINTQIYGINSILNNLGGNTIGSESVTP